MTNAVTVAQGASNNVTFRNRIINGACVIDQRNAGASVSVSTSGVYVLDRWKNRANGGGVFTVQQSSTTPAGFNTSSVYTVTTADSSIAAGDNYWIIQDIEGYNVADLQWGTSSAATVTISFWVRSSVTGTFNVGVTNGTTYDRSYVTTYTINSANTWEQKSVTIAGDTTGTWGKTNGGGISLVLSLGAGSTYQTTANTWSAGFYQATSSATNWIATSGATFYITGVQLEAGTTASPFEYRQYGTELALCQRYCFVFRGDATGTYANIGNAISINTTSQQPQFNVPVPMRAQPTLSYSAIGDLAMHLPGVVRSTLTALAVNTSQMGGAGVIRVVLSATTGATASFTSGIILSFEFNNTSTGWMALTAEL